MRKIFTTLILFVLSLFPAGAQSHPELITDLDDKHTGSNIQKIFESDGTVLFTADDGRHGQELFHLNPDTDEFEVFDLYPGAESSFPNSFIEVGHYVYFAGRIPESNGVLFRFNKLTNQVIKYEDISVVANSAFYASDGYLFFLGYSGDPALYMHNPATEKTIELVSRFSTPAVSIAYNNSNNICKIDDYIYFQATNFPFQNSPGSELWKVDINKPGLPELAADIRTGSEDSDPRYFLRFSEKLFFCARDGEKSWGVFCLDTNSNNISKIEGLTSWYTSPVFLDDKFYFSCSVAVEGNTRRELIQLDPRTLEIEILSLGNGSSFGIYPHNLAINGDSLFLEGLTDFDREEYELFEYDTTDKSLNQRTHFSNPKDRFENIYSAGDKVIFTINNHPSQLPENLWIYDPSTQKIRLIKDNKSNSIGHVNSNIILIDNKIYFRVYDPIYHSQFGIVNLLDGNSYSKLIVRDSTFSSDPEGFSQIEDNIFFIASSPASSRDHTQLYKFNPTSRDLTKINNRMPDNTTYSPNREIDSPQFKQSRKVLAISDKILMQASLSGSRTSGNLVIYDDTLSTSTIIGGSNSDPYSPREFYNMDNQYAFFTADSPDYGTELFMYDAQTGEVKLAVDLYAGHQNSNPLVHTSYQGKVYFEGRSRGSYLELFSYDPATDDCVLVNNHTTPGRPGIFSIYNHGQAQVIDDKLYYSGFDSSVSQGYALHIYDGNTDTFKVIHPTTENPASNPVYISGKYGLVAFGTDNYDQFLDLVYIYNPEDESLLKVSDGMIRASHPTFFNNKLYFAAHDVMTDRGLELYYYDLELEETFLTRDLSPGRSDGVIARYFYIHNQFVTSDNFLFFKGNNGSSGEELFALDKTGVITKLQETNPGHLSSYPSHMARFGDYVYLSGYSEALGAEPYYLDLNNIVVIPPSFSGWQIK